MYKSLFGAVALAALCLASPAISAAPTAQNESITVVAQPVKGDALKLARTTQEAVNSEFATLLKAKNKAVGTQEDLLEVVPKYFADFALASQMAESLVVQSFKTAVTDHQVEGSKLKQELDRASAKLASIVRNGLAAIDCRQSGAAGGQSEAVKEEQQRLAALIKELDQGAGPVRQAEIQILLPSYPGLVAANAETNAANSRMKEFLMTRRAQLIELSAVVKEAIDVKSAYRDALQFARGDKSELQRLNADLEALQESLAMLSESPTNFFGAATAAPKDARSVCI